MANTICELFAFIQEATKLKELRDSAITLNNILKDEVKSVEWIIYRNYDGEKRECKIDDNLIRMNIHHILTSGITNCLDKVNRKLEELAKKLKED